MAQTDIHLRPGDLNRQVSTAIQLQARPRQQLPQFIFFCACLLSIIFFPTYAISGAENAGQRLLYVVFPTALLSILIFTVFLTKKIYISSLAYLLLAAFLVFAVSIIAKLSFLDGRLIGAHWRYLAYGVIFISAYNLSAQYGLKLVTLEKATFLGFLLIIVFVLAQAVQPEMGILHSISNRRLIGHLGVQVGGPFVWSYSLGHFLILICFTLLARLWLGATSASSKLLLLVCLLFIALSQSKAVYLAFAILAFCLVVMVMSYRAHANRAALLGWLAICALLAGLTVSISGVELGNIDRFLESLAAGGIDASTQTRLNQIAVVGETINHNPWVGYPVHYLVIENAYAHYLYYFGIAGLLTYVSVLACICVANWRILHMTFADARLTRLRPFALGLLAYSAATIILSLAYAPLDGHKTGYVFWFLLGCYHGAFRRVAKEGTRWQRAAQE